MITAYYGKDGIMTDGWSSEEEAVKEFNEFYKDDPEYDGCFVTHLPEAGWVIAYE